MIFIAPGNGLERLELRMFNLIFFHVGNDIALPNIMVGSIRKHNPSARIIQATDSWSPEVTGIDEIRRFPGQADLIMLFRMECFSKIETSSPSWFLDTDMVCLRSLELPSLNKSTEIVAVLERRFNLDAKLPRSANGVDLSRYGGRPIGDVFPFVGCVVFLHNSYFWIECLHEYYKLDNALRSWWGDQEALKRVVKRRDRASRLASLFPLFGSRTGKVIKLPETSYACLPEFEASQEKPVFLHFKGPRKTMIDAYCRREQLVEHSASDMSKLSYDQSKAAI
jgi:hypothetical protein